MLCKKHHDLLDRLDAPLVQYVRNFMVIMLGKTLSDSGPPASRNDIRDVDGHLLERSLLKFACGALASRSLSAPLGIAQGAEIDYHAAKEELVRPLFGASPWPTEWLLHVEQRNVRIVGGPPVQLGFDLRWDDQGHLQGVEMVTFLFHSVLVLRPEQFVTGSNVLRQPKRLCVASSLPDGRHPLPGVTPGEHLCFNLSW